MCGGRDGDCRPLSDIVFGPGDNTERFRRWSENFDREMQKLGPDGFYRGPQFNMPMPVQPREPCPCCGAVYPPKQKTLAERVHVGP